MKKFIMILAALSLIGSIGISYLNFQDFTAVKEELKVVEGEIAKMNNDLNAAEQEKTDKETKETQAKDTRNQASAAVEEVRQKLLVVERDLETTNTSFSKVEVEQKEIDLLIRKTFPDGDIVDSEELKKTLDTLKSQLTEKQSKKAELNTHLTTAAQAKQVQVTKVREEEKLQVARAQKLSLNSLVATVIAANKEWGFVMVNAGRAHGVTPDASLLVKRGNSRVARLRIVSLEDNVTITDVIRESLSNGIDVQPGDKVIFENVQ